MIYREMKHYPLLKLLNGIYHTCTHTRPHPIADPNGCFGCRYIRSSVREIWNFIVEHDKKLPPVPGMKV